MRRARPLLLLVALALGACGVATASGRSAQDPGHEITVLAATSLTAPFTRLGEVFEAEHPQYRVTFGFGASSALAAQIVAGSPADVFAAASPETMGTAVTGLRDAAVPGADTLAPTTFATNRIALAVAPGSRVTSLTDLADPATTFALCEPQVPCGSAARRVLDAGGVGAPPVTYAPNVAAVLLLVRTGEVDAGLVYVTDLDGTVGSVEVPEVVTSYPIVALPEAPDPHGAAAFTALVLSPAGREILAEHGFGAP